MKDSELKVSMVNKNIAKLEKSLVEVTIQVPWVDLAPLWDQTLAKLGAEIELPGFRKGTAPANMVEQNLGAKMQDEFLKVAMPQFLIEALKGTDIIPIDYPQYQLTTFAKGSDLQYKARVTNRPQVSIGDYKTIKASKPAPKPVTEEEVTKVVDDLFKRWSARAGSQTSAPIQSGPTDSTNGGGSISFQSAATQPASDDVVKNALPNDEFAMAMGATNLIDLKAKIRKDLEDQINYNSELDFEEAILQEVEKITQVELPDILVQDELNRMLVSLQRKVADMGLLMEDYLKGQNETMDGLKAKWMPQAEKNVRMELGLAEIARMENVQISDPELQAEIDKIQDNRVKQQFQQQEPRLQLRHALRQTRTLNLLKGLVNGA